MKVEVAPVYEYETVVLVLKTEVPTNTTVVEAPVPLVVAFENVPELKALPDQFMVEVPVASVILLAPAITLLSDAYCVELVIGAVSPLAVAPPLQLLCEKVYVAALAILRLPTKRTAIEKIATKIDETLRIRRLRIMLFTLILTRGR